MYIGGDVVMVGIGKQDRDVTWTGAVVEERETFEGEPVGSNSAQSESNDGRHLLKCLYSLTDGTFCSCLG
jgi:hypothetical protein